MNKPRIAFVMPSLVQHAGRGGEVYAQNLFDALQQEKAVSVRKATFPAIPASCDIIHFAYFDPFFPTLPFLQTKPTVITIHDLIPFVFPAQFPVGIRGTVMWYLQKMRARGANKIITDSETSRADIIRIMNVSAQGITAIPLASAHNFRQIKNQKKLDGVRRKYKLPERFMLYVGDVNWNKNLPRLIAAVKKINATIVLVSRSLASPKNLSHPWNVSLKAALKEIRSDARFLIRSVSDTNDLTAFYNLASVFVFPSLYEGFGLPVIESFACGCPVVCSQEGSLKEITGGAATIVDPYDVDSIADGIGEVYFNESTQIQHSLAGFKQVKQFSWRKTAQLTAAVYQSVFNRIS